MNMDNETYFVKVFTENSVDVYKDPEDVAVEVGLSGNLEVVLASTRKIIGYHSNEWRAYEVFAGEDND